MRAEQQSLMTRNASHPARRLEPCFSSRYALPSPKSHAYHVQLIPTTGQATTLTCFPLLDLYLDNMEYGRETAPSVGTPRISAFDQNMISRLILADTMGLKGPAPARFFGAGKVTRIVSAQTPPHLSASAIFLRFKTPLFILVSCVLCKMSYTKGKLDTPGAQTRSHQKTKAKPAARGPGMWCLAAHGPACLQTT